MRGYFFHPLRYALWTLVLGHGLVLGQNLSWGKEEENEGVKSERSIYPVPFGAKRIDFGDPAQVAQVVHILQVYPLALRIIEQKDVVIRGREEQLAIYRQFEKQARLERRRNKILLIALGVAIPVVAAVVGYGVWSIARRY